MKKGFKPEPPKKSLAKGYELADMKPTISITTEMLPAVKSWKINKTYKVVLEIKMTGLHKEFGKDELRGDFDILNAGEEEKE